MPFVYEHPVYWQKIEEETKGSGDFERSTCLFIDSEKAREHSEEEMIKIENIKGRLYVVGADDDSFWEAGKYIRRMTKRLAWNSFCTSGINASYGVANRT